MGSAVSGRGLCDIDKVIFRVKLAKLSLYFLWARASQFEMICIVGDTSESFIWLLLDTT